ncbi:hypothetical protein, partial [Actinocorallia lasiicapitis]
HHAPPPVHHPRPSADEPWLHQLDTAQVPRRKRGTGFSVIVGAVVGVAAVLLGLFYVLKVQDKKEAEPVRAEFSSVSVGEITLNVPTGWKGDFGPKGSSLWKDPASAAYVQFDSIAWTGSAKHAAKQWERESSKTAFYTYEHVDLREVPGVGVNAADLEFIYKSRRSELTLHAVVRRIRTETGVYALLVAYPATVWTTKQGTVDNILASFKP